MNTNSVLNDPLVNFPGAPSFAQVFHPAPAGRTRFAGVAAAWLALSLVLFVSLIDARATMTLGSWTPMYQGVDFAIGTNTPDASFPRRQAVFVMRLDLTDPEVELFTDPPCNTCSGSAETKGLKTALFSKPISSRGRLITAFSPNVAVIRRAPR